MTATVLCVAGEASGDRLLAPVVQHLSGIGVHCVGVGGDLSAAAGLELLAHARDLAAHGLVEAAPTLPAVLRAWRHLVARLPAVDGLVLVDFPEVNLRLLRRAARRGLPAIYLAPPQAWAWRSHRARALRSARWVGCLLPFEARWFAERGVPAECIGHPLAERPPLPPAASPGLTLLPGSRASTVQTLLPIQLEVARVLRARHPALTVHVGAASTVDRGVITDAFDASGLPGAVHDDADPALARSTVCLAGAGTATLHATLAGRPVVTMARLHPLTAMVARRLVRVPHVALPNLVLGRRAFPECVQERCHADAIVDAIDGIVADPESWHADVAAVRQAVSVADGWARIRRRLDGLWA